ncbi:IPExxxVDY family protein [Flavobacterium sp. 3HN19-14]|uniref:IPExxxVDY family protein n=1 Tax=Flavobacterium sp. 3HN19-14 TaxID=3448133 RepID=UPI003EE0DFF3
MAIHKLQLDEFDEVDYELIAIHTALEDFRLAYYINQKLPVRLQKSKDEIQIAIKEGETRFSRFIFEDTEKEISWNLIQNKNEVTLQKKQNSQSLFADTSMEVSTKVYLLPEFKKVDYFLKVENAQSSTAAITKNINTIDRISAVYSVDIQHIKSKNNLIF